MVAGACVAQTYPPAWRQTLGIFDETEQRYRTLSLFPEDRNLPADAAAGVQVKLAVGEACPPRDQLLLRIGAAKTEAGRAFGFAKITLPREGEQIARQSFTFRLDKQKLAEAEWRDLTQPSSASRASWGCVRFITNSSIGRRRTSWWPSWRTAFG